MPAMLRIDTLKFAKRLTDAGMDRRQAEALVEGLNEADTSEFGTKADVGDLKAEIADVRGELAAFRIEFKADIADLKAELFRFMYVQAMGVVGLTRRTDRGADQAPAVNHVRHRPHER
jgi:hypothetical protein